MSNPFDDMKINDLECIFNDTGYLVSYNGFTTNGFLHREPTDALQLNNKNYSVFSNILTLTILTGSLGKILNKTNIIVNNINYEIDGILILTDGLETKLTLVSV